QVLIPMISLIRVTRTEMENSSFKVALPNSHRSIQFSRYTTTATTA
ncbi:hypothetical protein GCK32_021619, partial [Trichostrongylus colubriformis]